jgi:hypothetical protein
LGLPHRILLFLIASFISGGLAAKHCDGQGVAKDRLQCTQDNGLPLAGFDSRNSEKAGIGRCFSPFEHRMSTWTGCGGWFSYEPCYECCVNVQDHNTFEGTHETCDLFSSGEMEEHLLDVLFRNEVPWWVRPELGCTFGTTGFASCLHLPDYRCPLPPGGEPHPGWSSGEPCPMGCALHITGSPARGRCAPPSGPPSGRRLESTDKEDTNSNTTFVLYSKKLSPQELESGYISPYNQCPEAPKQEVWPVYLAATAIGMATAFCILGVSALVIRRKKTEGKSTRVKEAMVLQDSARVSNHL